MPDWSDTLKERENGELVGFIGHNETIDEDAPRNNTNDQPVTDVRRPAVDATKDADVEVVTPVPQPPAVNPNDDPAPKPTSNPDEGGPAGGDSDSTGSNDPAGGQANGDGDASNTGNNNAL